MDEFALKKGNILVKGSFKRKTIIFQEKNLKHRTFFLKFFQNDAILINHRSFF